MRILRRCRQDIACPLDRQDVTIRSSIASVQLSAISYSYQQQLSARPSFRFPDALGAVSGSRGARTLFVAKSAAPEQ